MARWHLLAVDDEPLNLEIIREYLDDPRMDVDLAPNAERAWQRLETAAAYDLIILDHLMPGMNGIELMRRMKADARFRRIPVIMQTAAVAPEQVRAGIEAGAYYYLTKPYEPAALIAIVRAALADVDDQAAAARRAAEQVETLRLLDAAEFRFATLDDASRLGGLLASLCPMPATAAVGLTELMVNAIEHGNLGITYAEKSRLKREDTWEAEIARRLGLPEHRDKWARVTFLRGAGETRFTIRDQGNGFDWQRYLDFEPVRAFDPNGRGIAMARMMSFSRIEYRGCGNEVIASVKL